MDAYLDEKRRRIGQFAQYLRLMRLRRHKIARDDCYLIFDDSLPRIGDMPSIKESVHAGLAMVLGRSQTNAYFIASLLVKFSPPCGTDRTGPLIPTSQPVV